MEKLNIKVCGLTRLADFQQLAEMGVQYGGMIFYKQSPRFVNAQLPTTAIKKFNGLQKVGVFVNATREEILRQVDRYGLDLVQLHGDESPVLCDALKRNIPVIKVFRIRSEADLIHLNDYMEVCDFLLFDTPGKLYGGNGTTFNWDVLRHYAGTVPFFLSGGISSEAIAALKAFSHPRWHAVDVNSCFEISPGIKNLSDIKQFIWDLNIR